MKPIELNIIRCPKCNSKKFDFMETNKFPKVLKLKCKKCKNIWEKKIDLSRRT